MRFNRSAPGALLLAGYMFVLGGCGEMMLGRDYACEHRFNTFPCGGEDVAVKEEIRYLKITGAVSFDGRVVEYDELLQAKYRTVTRLAAADAHDVLLSDRKLVVKPVGTGSLALLVPSQVPGEVDGKTVAWNGPDDTLHAPGKRPPYVLFRWMDDPSRPTRVEEYDSLEYLRSSTARLKIKGPFRFTWLKSTPELDAEWRTQAEAPRQAATAWSNFDLRVVLYAVDRDGWSKAEGVADFIAAHRGAGPIVLDAKTSSAVAWKAGISWDRTGNEIPVLCSSLGTRCTPLLDDRGYSTFYARNTLDPRGIPLDFGTGVLRLPVGRSVYVPETETIYLLAEW